METIKEAKDYLRANFEKGCRCPACDQVVKLYKRKLNTGMCLFLIGLYRLTVKKKKDQDVWNRFFHNSEIMAEMSINTSSLDYSVMKHFGLIEKMVNEDPTIKDSGFWRITKEGWKFVVGTTTVPAKVHIYNNKVCGFSKDHIHIKEALTERFDYRDFLLTPVPVVRK